MTNVKLR